MRPRIVMLLGLVLAVAACGQTPVPSASVAGIPTLSPPPIDLSGVPATVHVEEPKVMAAWIGPAGGRLTTTAADGTAYELDIPEYAVADATPITMTPITAVDELGLSGGLAGAVFLQPAGLALAVPATLRITTSRAAPQGTRLAGFDVADDGTTVNLVPTAGSGPEVSVLVFHFSAPGAGYGTTQDLARLGAPRGPQMAMRLSELMAIPTPWNSLDLVQVELLITSTWTTTMDPELRDTTTDAALLRTIADWRTFIFMLNLSARAGDASAALADGGQYVGNVSRHTVYYLGGQGTLGTQIARAIDGNKALCNTSHDLNALANISFWAGLGVRYDPGSRDWESMVRGCAEIVVATFNPAPMLEAAGSGSLGLVFALKFTDGTQVPGDFEVTLHGVGFTFASTGGPDMTAGAPAGSTLTAGVFGQQPPPYTLVASACWYLGGLARNICSTTFQLPFGSGATASPSPMATGSGQVIDISGTYLVTVVCNFADYGRGTGHLTQVGTDVQMSWTVTLAPKPESAGDSLCFDPYLRKQIPESGSFTGTVTWQSGAPVWILISGATNDPCYAPDKPPTEKTQYGMRSFLLPVGGCVPGGVTFLYKAMWQGP